MLRQIASHHVVPTARLPIYLADTLAPPTGAAGVIPRLGFMAGPIVDKRRSADTLKRDTPIIAILGNPPYRRLGEGEEEALTSGWKNGFWDDLKKPVRDAGWGGELNTFPDRYIAFWRWCLWKLFESDGAPKRGVVCLITNRTFLAGHPYAGLRKMLRDRFDTIDIVDLRGDLRGARPAGIEADENVFAIQVGVCILIGVATGKEREAGTEARVRYMDVWKHGAFTIAQKLGLMERIGENSAFASFVDVLRSGLDDFLPAPFSGLCWPALAQTFLFSKSGSKSQRDDLVYGLSEAAVLMKVRSFSGQPEDEALRAFFPGQNGDAEREPVKAERLRFTSARDEAISPSRITEYVYRPFDYRYLYSSPNFVSRYGPDLQAAWGARNRALYALPSGTGAGPAVWVHGLLPDYHAFSGRGGYAFPLWDHRKGSDTHNLHPTLLHSLATAYGQAVSPEHVFAAIAALLSATSYTRRFAWDLEEAFAHIPFPADVAVFDEAARIGKEIIDLETFAREPAPAYRSARLLGRASGITLAVPPISRAFLSNGAGGGFVALQEDQSLRVANLPERVWNFAVSGYRVLPRWLLARNGEALDSALQRAILDIAWRIQELLHWFDAADPVLDRAIADSLPRTTLGL